MLDSSTVNNGDVSSSAAPAELDVMNEILPRLWLGDIASPQDAKTLEEKNIRSILSVMDWEVYVPEGITHKQIWLDDVEHDDLLANMVPSIEFIQSELDKGHGVLVHCFAGQSRSASIVAAYIMYSQKVDFPTARRQLRSARPLVRPNPGFVAQLDILYKAISQTNTEDSTEEEKLRRIGVTLEELKPTKEELKARRAKFFTRK
ncbi:hypothetical protein FRC20_001760 [Serendipita sp. 405]|nr:hypothetical protein FRC15_002598 [Serendipita sp. 397]KAG8787609.1 hypothetical protein FRC16_001524 [Serendipita sp. 398]KAG8851410.1 hypothetical protein FRC20_001760 [Serendipita sp. 405]